MKHAILLIALLIPAGMALAQQDTGVGAPADKLDIIPDDQTVGPVGIVNELERGHSAITTIMEDTSSAIANTGYADEKIFYEMVYVDYDNETLVVWLDPAQSYDPPTISDIQEDAGVIIPVEIIFGIVIPDALSREATPCPPDGEDHLCYYWGRYITRCLPERTTSRCTTYTTIINDYGYEVPVMLDPATLDFDNDGIPNSVDQCIYTAETVNQYQDTDGCPDTAPVVFTPPPASSDDVIFSDDFEGGLSAWTVEGNWESKVSDELQRYPADWPDDNLVAEADGRCSDCTMELASALDLSLYKSATLSFDRFVDDAMDDDEYLKVELSDGASWATIFEWSEDEGSADDVWHPESYDLADYLGSDFSLRFSADPSSSSEDVGVDNIRINGTLHDTSVRPEGTVIFSDDFEGGLSAWTVDGDWENKVSDEYLRYLEGWPDDNLVAEAEGSCPDCTMELASSLDLSPYTSAALHFDRFVDRSLDDDEYLKVELYSGSSWTTIFEWSENNGSADDMWHSEGYHLGDYLRSGFSLRFSADPSTSSEEVAVDNVRITGTLRDGYMPSQDSDGDGVADASDSCPNQAGSSGDGCPDQCEATDSMAESCHLPDGSFPQLGGDAVEFFGGDRHIARLRNSTGELENYPGTIATGAYNQSHHGVVVAAHSIEERYGKTFFVHNIESREDGTIKYLSNKHGTLRNGGNIDAAFIPITVSDITVGSKVRAHNGTVTEVAWGRLADVERLEEITIYGWYNNGPGILMYKNATHLSFSGTLRNMGIGIYPSQGGDSGSAIVHHEGDAASIVGVHWGSTCVFDSNFEVPSLIDVRTDLSLCNNISEYYHYKMFSAWENVEDGLNLVRPE
ncbi:hypothetical protein CENSYa_1230 [Cenarchaeum symbiosum A]|uniref:Uncharacterized protein n=1 Tax=Cenarchaeum symbiosum (strain A) TaxID=414004 RepID=A0RWY6_CENSY|nr:hypothetical protein CENSYa_1230 [Cenarchaeum symbiosum A]